MLLILSFLFLSCSPNLAVNEKEIELSEGRTVRVSFEEKQTSAGEKVLVADYRNDERVIREATVDEQVVRVWSGLEEEAGRRGIREGVIRAAYLVGEDERTGEPVYEEFLFSSEKIENGTWQIKKVN